MHADLPRFVSDPNPAVYLGDNYVVADFECTNREHGSPLDGSNCLLLACWRVGPAHANYQGSKDYVSWADEFGQHLLLDAINTADYLIAHHTKFEIGWLRRCGVDLRRILSFCTLVAEKVIAGNRKVELSLDATATRRGLGGKEATVSKLIKTGVCPSQIPEGMLEAYCKQDVSLTEQVFLAQRIELQELALLPVAYCRNLVTPALADIEFNGMTLDACRVSAAFEDYSERYEKLQESFAALTGGINVKSPKQMREFIYGTLKFEEVEDFRGKVLKTESGESMTDKHTLAKLKAETPEQKAFLKVANELVKLKTPLQNLTKMMAIAKASPDDPRVFAVFNQTVTQTDRLSSTGRRGGFQFQNLDRAFKRLFRARTDGCFVCEADAPQLEFRVGAFLGNDARAKEDILRGADVHAATAATLGVSRQNAKAFTFKPLYGGTTGTARERKYYSYFRERYNSLYRTQESWTMEVVQKKSLTTATGLRFYWPDTEITKSGYVTNTTSIFNYPIQSLATADIMPLVLVLIWHRVSVLGDGATIVNTIHDSIISEVSPNSLDAYSRILVECFTKDIYELLRGIYGIEFDVPLGVGIKAGAWWGEGEEQKHEPVDHKIQVD